MLGGFTRMKVLSTLCRIGGWVAIGCASLTLVIALVGYFRSGSITSGLPMVAGISSVGNFFLGGFLLLLDYIMRPKPAPTGGPKPTV